MATYVNGHFWLPLQRANRSKVAAAAAPCDSSRRSLFLIYCSSGLPDSSTTSPPHSNSSFLFGQSFHLASILLMLPLLHSPQHRPCVCVCVCASAFVSVTASAHLNVPQMPQLPVPLTSVFQAAFASWLVHCAHNQKEREEHDKALDTFQQAIALCKTHVLHCLPACLPALAH